MSFIESLRQARELLRQEQRLSLRALGRELGLDDETLDEIADELVEIQQLARREGRALVWCGGADAGEAQAGPAQPPAPGPLDYTPRHLAERILASRSALEGEKKQVTVLFCDVAGSMDLAEALGPEGWHETLDSFFEVLTRAVHNFEGTINQYTGDGVMALFGAPVALEEHARCAGLAALEIQRELEPLRAQLAMRDLPFAARVGLNSGVVVVGRIGDDLRMDYTAQGQVVGIAARLENLAAPGQILVSEFTQAQLEDYFELEPLGPTAVKGVSRPIGIARLRGARMEANRFNIARQRGLSRFVGRDQHLAELVDMLGEVRGGRGRTVGVVAEAGAGKSRLCYEFLNDCRAQGLTVLECHAVSHGRHMAWLPIRQLLRSYCGLDGSEPPTQALGQVRERLLRDQAEDEAAVPVVAAFLGLRGEGVPECTADPERLQAQLVEVLCRIVCGVGFAGPVITYVEDLHWLDSSSERALRQCLDALEEGRGMMVVNYRPEYQDHWLQGARFRCLRLEPLGADEVGLLLRDRLGEHPSVTGLARRVFERTGGNPFFCEEVLHALRESGALRETANGVEFAGQLGALEIPASVHDVLAARIDRLDDDSKMALQAAAVIGRYFRRDALERLINLPGQHLGRILDTLQQGGFIQPDSAAGRGSFLFAHALIQDVAKSSLLGSRLKALHAEYARILQEVHATDLDAMAALIAHHLEAAGEALAAAQWLMRSTEHLWAQDIEQTLSNTQNALRLTASLPESPEQQRCRLHALRAIIGRSIFSALDRKLLERYVEEASGLAEALGDPVAAARIRLGYANALGFNFGEVEAWVEGVGAVLEMEERLPEQIRAAIRGNDWSYALFIRGRLAEAGREASAAFEVLARYPDDPAMSAAHAIVGFYKPLYRAMLGDLSGALAELESNRAGLRPALLEQWKWQFLEAEMIIRHLGAGPQGEAGLPADGRALVAGEVALTDSNISMRLAAALGLLRAGQPAAAVRLIEEQLALFHATARDLELESRTLAFLSEACFAAGEPVRAQQTARQAVALARRHGARQFEVQARLALAAAELPLGADAAALAADLDELDRLIQDTGAMVYRPRVLELRARLAARQGDRHTARQCCASACRAYREIGAHGAAQVLEEQFSA